MSTLPLHPVLVHFPIVIAFLVPPAAALVAWVMFPGKLKQRYWMIPVTLQTIVFATAWAAVQLGEKDEERVEAVVNERVLEEHEELGERFLLFSGGLLLLMMVPLVVKNRFLRPIIAIISLAGTIMVTQVGHSGGELVYNHGAASVFAGPATQAPQERMLEGNHHDDDDDDDD